MSLDYVTTDGFGGMLSAVQHLLNLGHRRIGFVAFDLEHSGQRCRYLGYEQALHEWGLASDPALVCELAETPVEDFKPLVSFLSSPKRPTALVTNNDYLAIKTFNLCSQMGIRIPEDLALVGFDDIDISAQLAVPLTTVTQPIFDMGYQAAKLLLDKINHRVSGTRHLILPAQLTIRDSCGARNTIYLPV
jgi:DNA-binding LacI/PurR family transcriptional regulator